MSRSDKLDSILREMAASQPQFGRQLPTWLLIQAAPPPEEGADQPASLFRDSVRWHPPGSEGIRKAAAGGVKGEDDFSFRSHEKLHVEARWWENRFVITWRATKLDPHAKLLLTFLNPLTGVPLTDELDAGRIFDKHKDILDCMTLGFSPTRDPWTLQIRIVPRPSK
jgi:hypothetical protein